MSESNRVQQWFDETDAAISASYAENHVRARDSSRIQQTGHAAEQAWGRVLTQWLPPQYEVVFRKYILPEIETETYKHRETDIVVLRPGYPVRLRDREEVLAAGVAAAFSVKLTLNASGLREAAEEAAQIRRHVARRLGTARQEACPPFRYGVLGHAHSFGADPRANVGSNYRAADLAFSKHPRESLDMVCIADLGVWSKQTMTWMPVWDESERVVGNLVADHYAVGTFLIDQETSKSDAYPRTAKNAGMSSTASPVSVFVSELYRYLAQEDPQAQSFHHGLIGTGITGSGMGTGREWDFQDVYTEATQQALFVRSVNGRDPEWSMNY